MASIDAEIGRPDKILASETTGRFLVTIHASNRDEFERLMGDSYHREIGVVGRDDQINITYDGLNDVSTRLEEMRNANKGGVVHGHAA